MGVALAAVEAIEDMALDLGADARARVLHLDRDRVPVAVCAKDDRAARRVLGGVLAEIAQRLLEQVAVRLDREAVRDLHVYRDAGVGLEAGGDVAQERGKLDRLYARLLLPGVRAGKRQHRAGEPRQPAGLALDVAEEAVALDGFSFAPA